jgi:uncharacterized protein
VSRRHDRPNAVLWLLRNHPELRDSQIMRLVGTTKPTIAQIRERTHWNSNNLTPQDPVTLGLCTQIDLDAEVKKAAKRAAKDQPATGEAPPKAETLLPVAETTNYVPASGPSAAETARETEKEEEARMLERLKGLSDAPETEPEEDKKAEAEAEPDR